MTVSKRDDLGSPAGAASAGTGSGEGCNCFREVNEHLKTLGGELLCSFLSNPQRVFIATHKKKGARKVPLVQASFCPFCGNHYPPARSIFTDDEHPLDEGQNRAQSAGTQI